ncbi:hypothetical protein HDV00_001371 [Rhizophlyctis rosea]|nr:hypothetical protein HDV00_001371 [Rhizophlyctis rosea]
MFCFSIGIGSTILNAHDACADDYNTLTAANLDQQKTCYDFNNTVATRDSLVPPVIPIENTNVGIYPGHGLNVTVLMPEKYLGVWLYQMSWVPKSGGGGGGSCQPSANYDVKFYSFVADGKCWPGDTKSLIPTNVPVYLKTSCDDSGGKVQVYR